jgi:tetratricopeptide (TPR) repeat protein
MSSDTVSADTAAAQAVDYHKKGQLDEAEALYRSVLEQNPSDFNAIHLLGILYAQSNRLEQAAALIGRAIEINPTVVEARFNLGRVFQELSRPDDALFQYNEALARKPDYEEALLFKGTTLFALNRLPESLDAFDRLLAIQPDNPQVLNNRGVVLRGLNRQEEALESFERVLEIQPDSPQVATHVYVILNERRLADTTLAAPAVHHSAEQRKIGVIVATRGRPAQAATVIESARWMASGKHHIEYVVACDDDDPADSAGYFSRVSGVKVDCRPRPDGVAQCWNRCVSTVDADSILTLTDDGLVVTPHWDLVAAAQLSKSRPELAIASLQSTDQPSEDTHFLASKAWVDMAGLFDERFPFWFSDTAIAETYSFATGSMIPRVNITLALKPFSVNPRLRDMDLWWDLYAATRQERLQLAARIRDKLGLQVTARRINALVRVCELRDSQVRANSKNIVANLPNPAPVSSEYLSAKAAAEEYLRKFKI